VALGVDTSREWMRPLSESGSQISDDPELENVKGCWPGPMMQMNLKNGGQPGYEYTWELNKDYFRVCRLEGGEAVKSTDHDAAVMSYLQETGQQVGTRPSPLDSTCTNGELFLVRWPAAKVREKHERENAKALAMLRGGAEDFVQKASAAERAASSRATRFRRSDHALQMENNQGQVVEVWQPDQGIIREG
jgi:hypothetical protein